MTKKPLKELKDELLRHIDKHSSNLVYHRRLQDIHEGQLRKEVEDSMRREFSPKAFAKAKERIPSINLLTRVVDKRSRVYCEPAIRVSNKEDKSNVTKIESEANIDGRMGVANRMFNLHKSVALEPYVKDGDKIKVRVIPKHLYILWSDDFQDMTNPTVFIKCMGTRHVKNDLPFTDRDGEKTVGPDVAETEVDVYHCFSDTEFMELEGSKITKYVKHDIGRIPFVVKNQSEFSLNPIPDIDSLDITILVPKLMADLNYAIKHQAHSLFTAVDLDVPDELMFNPDNVIALQTSQDAPKQGKIDVVKPQVDIEEVMSLIKDTVIIWLETKNIKAGKVEQSSEERASGLAKIIDESDASQDRLLQTIVFSEVEQELWRLISHMVNYWIDSKEYSGSKKFSNNFNIDVKFAEQRPRLSTSEKTKFIEDMMSLNLMSRSQAVRYMYPYMTEEQVKDYLNMIDKESKENESKNLFSAFKTDAKYEKSEQVGESDSTDYLQEN